MRPAILLAAGAAALATAGLAVADGTGTKAIKPVAGTFAATNVLKMTSRTCAAAEGPISVMNTDLSGSSMSTEPALTGPARFRLRVVVDTAKQIGTADGSLRIDVASGRDTTAQFDGVYAAGKVHGLLRGRAARPFQRLIGNVSASLGPGGLTSGKIGATDAGGGALLLEPGRCRPAAPQRVVAVGLVSQLTMHAITVASVSCEMPDDLAIRANRMLDVGDRAEIRCRLVSGQLVLERFERKR